MEKLHAADLKTAFGMELSCAHHPWSIQQRHGTELVLVDANFRNVDGAINFIDGVD